MKLYILMFLLSCNIVIHKSFRYCWYIIKQSDAGANEINRLRSGLLN